MAASAELNKQLVESSAVCLCLGAGGRAGTGGPPSAGVLGDDGWTAVSRPPKSNIVDPSRLKLTKREQLDDSSIQLGPGGRGMGWHRGSSGGAKQQSADAPVQQPNRLVVNTDHTRRDSVTERHRGLEVEEWAGTEAAVAELNSSQVA